jgi:hypothetical protein
MLEDLGPTPKIPKPNAQGAASEIGSTGAPGLGPASLEFRRAWSLGIGPGAWNLALEA